MEEDDGRKMEGGEERTKFFTSFCIRTVFLGPNRRKREDDV